MANFVFSNFTSSTLASPITTTTQTSITLASTANFPTIPSGSYWAVTLNDVATGLVREIVYAQGISGATLTGCLRGQEGTTAHTWAIGDIVYGGATAAEFGNFIQGTIGGPFVQLSPASPQSGNIKITGAVNAGSGNFTGGGGVAVGGPITSATFGSFSQYVIANNFQITQNYGNIGFGALPLIYVGDGFNVIGVGPTSHFSAFGITSSALAIGAQGSTDGIFIDQNGNLAATRALYSIAGVFTGNVQAAKFIQAGNTVADTLESTDGSITIGNPSEGLWNLRVAPITQLPSGSTLFAKGGSAVGTTISIVLPNYGTWALFVSVGLIQSDNNNYNLTIAHTTGTTTGFVTNANGTNSSNQVHTINATANCTAAGGQTIGFAVSSSAGVFNSSQPWSILAVRQ